MGPATAFGLNAYDDVSGRSSPTVSARRYGLRFRRLLQRILGPHTGRDLVADTIGGADVNAGAATGVTVAPGVSASISGFDFSGFFSTGIASQGDLYWRTAVLLADSPASLLTVGS